MIEVLHKEDCCGCTACAAVCPVEAISMEADEKGFLYPRADAGKCIGCGRCEEVCAFRKPSGKDGVWALARFQAHMGKSQSGGLAAEAARRWGGVVYGAVLDKDFRTVHQRAEEGPDARQQGSKYTQSRLGDSFRRVQEDLAAGRKVLFTGTPCQVAGLQSFLPEEQRENLLTLDIACHGVTAPRLWEACVAEQQPGLEEARMRDTDLWRSRSTRFTVNGKKRRIDSFITLYNKDFLLRPSCTACPFACTVRPSDITAADAWGIEHTSSPLNDGKPLSLAILSTEKGRALFPELTPLQDRKPFLQPSFVKPVQANPADDVFFAELQAHGYSYVARRYGRVPLLKRLRTSLVKLKRKLLPA